MSILTSIKGFCKILQNIDIDKAILKNIDIDKEILENIDIDRILNRSEFGKPDRAYHTEPKDRRLSAESPTALSQPNQRKLLYATK